MYYNPILRVNINMHTSHPCHAGARSAWLCHVALRATSHPRGSRAIITPFLLILIDLNSFKIENILK